MSYFFSSQRLNANRPTFELPRDDEEDESGGVFIVEANVDPSDAAIPLLLDQDPSLATSFLGSSSNGPAFQATDASVALDDVDLSQSDLKSLDDLFSALDHTNPAPTVAAPPLCEPIDTEQEAKACAKNRQSSRVQVLANGAHDFSPFEKIGSFQMKQSLELSKDQTDKSIVKRKVMSKKRTVWEIFRSCAALLRWVFWTFPSLLICGAVRSVLLVASTFAGMWYFGTLSCNVISSVYNPVAAFIVPVWSLGTHVYGLVKVALQVRTTGASSVVVAFVAGMATMMFFGATACLLKYSASAALKMLHVMIASAITRQIRKNICKLRSILHLSDDFVPVAMPRRSPVDTRRIDELLERGIDVIEEPAPASRDYVVSKLHKKDTLSHHFVSKITNAYHKNSRIVSDPDFVFSSRIFPVANNETWGLRDLFANHGLIDGLKVNSSFLIAPMNVALLVVLALAYVRLPRKCVTPAAVIPCCKSEESFTSLSGKSLEIECRERGLKVPVLREDKIRLLCIHDGIEHSFAQRNPLNYTKMTKVQLKAALSDLGVNSSGNKEDLQYRLLVARERVYSELSLDELKVLSQQHGIKGNGMELACRLAEAGPQLPLQVNVSCGARLRRDKEL